VKEKKMENEKFITIEELAKVQPVWEEMEKLGYKWEDYFEECPFVPRLKKEENYD
jgi:hypothetical protein